MPNTKLITPRRPIFGAREPIFQPQTDRLLTEDGAFFLVEEGLFLSLEVRGK